MVISSGSHKLTLVLGIMYLFMFLLKGDEAVKSVVMRFLDHGDCTCLWHLETGTNCLRVEKVQHFYILSLSTNILFPFSIYSNHIFHVHHLPPFFPSLHTLYLQQNSELCKGVMKDASNIHYMSYHRIKEGEERQDTNMPRERYRPRWQETARHIKLTIKQHPGRAKEG